LEKKIIQKTYIHLLKLNKCNVCGNDIQEKDIILRKRLGQYVIYCNYCKEIIVSGKIRRE
jgi:hypothetical protein